MKFAKEVWKMVEAGEERPVQGLLEQWLREGKMTEREAVMSSNNMFIAGVDTVSFNNKNCKGSTVYKMYVIHIHS